MVVMHTPRTVTSTTVKRTNELPQRSRAASVPASHDLGPYGQPQSAFGDAPTLPKQRPSVEAVLRAAKNAKVRPAARQATRSPMRVARTLPNVAVGGKAAAAHSGSPAKQSSPQQPKRPAPTKKASAAPPPPPSTAPTLPATDEAPEPDQQPTDGDDAIAQAANDSNAAALGEAPSSAASVHTVASPTADTAATAGRQTDSAAANEDQKDTSPPVSAPVAAPQCEEPPVQADEVVADSIALDSTTSSAHGVPEPPATGGDAGSPAQSAIATGPTQPAGRPATVPPLSPAKLRTAATAATAADRMAGPSTTTAAAVAGHRKQTTAAGRRPVARPEPPSWANRPAPAQTTANVPAVRTKPSAAAAAPNDGNGRPVAATASHGQASSAKPKRMRRPLHESSRAPEKRHEPLRAGARLQKTAPPARSHTPQASAVGPAAREREPSHLPGDATRGPSPGARSDQTSVLHPRMREPVLGGAPQTDVGNQSAKFEPVRVPPRPAAARRAEHEADRKPESPLVVPTAAEKEDAKKQPKPKAPAPSDPAVVRTPAAAAAATAGTATTSSVRQAPAPLKNVARPTMTRGDGAPNSHRSVGTHMSDSNADAAYVAAHNLDQFATELIARLVSTRAEDPLDVVADEARALADSWKERNRHKACQADSGECPKAEEAEPGVRHWDAAVDAASVTDLVPLRRAPAAVLQSAQAIEAGMRFAASSVTFITAANQSTLIDAASVEYSATEPLEAPIEGITATAVGWWIHVAQRDRERVDGLEFQLHLPYHAAPVTCVASSPDGRTLATASVDRTVRTWDARTGCAIRVFEGHEDSVNAVAFSSDGSKLVSGSADGTVRTWDARSGRVIRVVADADCNDVQSVAFQPNCATFAAATAEGVRIRDTSSGKTKLLIDDQGAVTALRFSPDGTQLATGGADGSVQLRNAATGLERRNTVRLLAATGTNAPLGDDNAAPIDEEEGPAGAGNGSVSQEAQDGPHGASASSKEFLPSAEEAPYFNPDVSAELAARREENLMEPIAPCRGAVRCIAYSNDSTTVAIACAEGQVRVLSAVARLDRYTITVPFVRSVVFAPNGLTFATAGDDGRVRVFDVESGEQTQDIEAHSGAVVSVAFLGTDGAVIASAGYGDFAVRLWNVRGGTQRLSIQGHREPIVSIAFSPDGCKLATAGGVGAGAVRVWALPPHSAGVFVQPTSGSRNGWTRGVAAMDSPSGVTSVIFTLDGRAVLAACEDGIIRSFSAANGGAFDGDIYKGHTDAVRGLCLSPDGATLATCSDDCSFRTWDCDSRRAKLAVRGHNGPVGAIAYARHGRHIATVGRPDGQVRTWDAKTGDPLATIRTSASSVERLPHSIGFDADGRIVAAALDRIQSYDAVTGEAGPMSCLDTDSITCCAVAADGTSVVTGGVPDMLWVWETRDGDVATTLQDSRLGGWRECRASCVAVSPDGAVVASGAESGVVALWRREAQHFTRAIECHSGVVAHACVSPDGVRVASVTPRSEKDGRCMVCIYATLTCILLAYKVVDVGSASPTLIRFSTITKGHVVIELDDDREVDVDLSDKPDPLFSHPFE